MLMPYRLVSHSELERLTVLLSDRLQQWNEHYALIPLNLSLTKATAPLTKSSTLVQGEAMVLACLPEDHQKISQTVLFGQHHEDFNEVSTELFTLLVTDLFQQKCHLTSATPLTTSWFYPVHPVFICI